MAPATCSPTWAQPSVDGAKIFVACNKADEILEIDTKSWTLARRLPTGRGVYNLAVTADGKLLVATLKQGSMVEIFDLAGGKSLARIKTSNTLAHGVTRHARLTLRVRHQRRRRLGAGQSGRDRSQRARDRRDG